MAGSDGYVVKVSGKRAAGGADETLYIDLGRLVLAAESEQGIALVLEGGRDVYLAGEDADWVREILGKLAQPRKAESRNVLHGGQR